MNWTSIFSGAGLTPENVVLNGSRIFVSGQSGIDPKPSLGLYYSDDGVIWNQPSGIRTISLLGQWFTGVDGISIVAPGTIYIIRGSTPLDTEPPPYVYMPSIYKSTDNGVTFTSFTGSVALGGFAQITNIGSNIFVMDQLNGVYYSDGVSAWSLRNNGLPTIGGAGSVDLLNLFTDGTNLFVMVRCSLGAPTYTLYRSTDFGVNWTSVQSFTVSYYQSHNAVVLGGTIYACMGGLKKSSNGGLTWTDTVTPQPNAKNVATDGVNLYAGAPPSLLKSTDGGSTWSDITANLTGGSYYISADSNAIYVPYGGSCYISIIQGKTSRGNFMKLINSIN